LKKASLIRRIRKSTQRSIDALTKLDIPEDIAKAFAQVAEERIRIKMVKVKGTLELRCMQPNGVKCIQDSIINAKKAQKPKVQKSSLALSLLPLQV